MIDYPWLKQHLQDIIVDTEGNHWGQEFINNAVHEAVLSITRLRPELLAVTTRIPVNGDLYTFDLPEAFETFISVSGLVTPSDNGEIVQSLQHVSESDALSNDPCWRASDDKPTQFIFSLDNVYRVYIVGEVPADSLLEVVASQTPVLITNDTETIPLRMSFLPDLINYSLTRLYSRLDSAAGKADMHYNHFRTGLSDKTSADSQRNPVIHALTKQQRR